MVKVGDLLADPPPRGAERLAPQQPPYPGWKPPTVKSRTVIKHPDGRIEEIVELGE
jgi:hypothetical protein